MNRQQPSLLFCILMDLVGYATYAVPFLGEFGDIIWAPISSAIFMTSFGGWKGVLGGLGNFIEELLPGTDFIPSFTIMWFVQYMQKKGMTTSVKFSKWRRTFYKKPCLILRSAFFLKKIRSGP